MFSMFVFVFRPLTNECARCCLDGGVFFVLRGQIVASIVADGSTGLTLVGLHCCCRSLLLVLNGSTPDDQGLGFYLMRQRASSSTFCRTRLSLVRPCRMGGVLYKGTSRSAVVLYFWFEWLKGRGQSLPFEMESRKTRCWKSRSFYSCRMADG